MLRMFIKVKYYYHLIQHRHNEFLKQDCLDKELLAKLKVKASYHNSKVVEFALKM